MTREEIHKNVLTIRNYYFSIQNKLDNGYKIYDLDIDSETHNKINCSIDQISIGL